MGILDLNADLEYLESLGESNEELSLNEPDEWRVKRLGSVTGSTFGKFVKTEKDGFKLSSGKVAKDLIYKIAWERLLKEGNISNGLGRLNVSSQAMNHGNDNEGAAIQKYIEVTGNEVIYEQEYISLSEWIGGTPDGFVGKDGILEVKCPWNGGNHLQTLLTGTIYNPEHMYQIQGYLWITDRKWCDFITYDPDLIEELQITITRIERDENIIKGIESVVNEVIEQIKELIQQVKNKLD